MTPEQTIEEMKGNNAHLLHQLDRVTRQRDELLKIVQMVAAASIFEVRPGNKEFLIGWQRSDQASREITTKARALVKALTPTP